MFKNIKKLSNTLGISSYDLLGYSKNQVRKKLFEQYTLPIEEKWKISVVKDLLECRDDLKYCSLSKKNISLILDYVCLN